VELEAAAREFGDTMRGYPSWWGVAGGWAIDLYLGKKTREHEDLEVVALRRDQAALHAQLQRRAPSLIHPGDPVRFEPWDGSPFPEAVIQLRLPGGFDVLLTPAEGDRWICRRHEATRLPLEHVVRPTASGVPALAPEVVLLFKAKRVEQKDESDFRNALPALDPEARKWLREMIGRLYPGHAWLARL
jgi:hypothetical protein